MSAPGRLFVVSGPSGVGKSTVLKRALGRLPGLEFSVSLTTRSPRPGEVDGKDYHFVSREDFERRIAKGEMAEWAEFNGNLYGTSLKVVAQGLEEGRDILLEIEVQGAAQIKKRFPGAELIFILPPSAQVLEERLRHRGTESEEVVQKRLALAKQEIEQASQYDHQVVNENIEGAVERLVELMS